MSEQLGLLPGFEKTIGILEIRAMNPGKVRNAAIESLNKKAENWLNENRHLGIYIPGNVASSKNSKEIGTYKKYDENHVLQKHTILRNSAITDAYILTTKPKWVDSRKRFKSLTEGLKMPLFVEFTFIRESLRRFDFVNAAQLPLDLMAEHEYITDDETCYIVPVFNPIVFYHAKLAGLFIKVLGGNELPLAF